MTHSPRLSPALSGLALSVLVTAVLAACGEAGAPATDGAAPLTVNGAFVVVPPGGRDVTLGGAVLTAGAGDVVVTGVMTPAAERVELHTMSMQDGRMQMRQLDTLEIPAGGTRTLARGGDHLMLFGLDTLEAGTQVPMSFTYRTGDGAEASLKVEAEVRTLGTPPAQ